MSFFFPFDLGRKHKKVELIKDPSSNELSMSRYLLWMIVQIYWPVNVLAEIFLRLLGKGKMENWTALGVMTGAVAGVYWFNSMVGSYQRGAAMVAGAVAARIPKAPPGE